MGINIKKIPSIITQELVREFFIDKIFHADPHPGNILLLPKNKIALLDFGIMGESISYNRTAFIKFVESTTRTQYTHYEESILNFSDFASQDLKNTIGSALPVTISEKKLDEIMNLLTNHFSSTLKKLAFKGREQLETMKKDYVVFSFEVIKAAQKYKIKLPNQIVAFV